MSDCDAVCKLNKESDEIQWHSQFDNDLCGMVDAYDLKEAGVTDKINDLVINKEFSDRNGRSNEEIVWDTEHEKEMCDIADTVEREYLKKMENLNAQRNKRSLSDAELEYSQNNTSKSKRNQRASVPGPLPKLPKEKVNCNICNSLVDKRYFSRHANSALHKNNLIASSDSVSVIFLHNF